MQVYGLRRSVSGGLFYEGENMLVINPDECIDCGVCEPECPANAIKPDTEENLEQWLQLNAPLAGASGASPSSAPAVNSASATAFVSASFSAGASGASPSQLIGRSGRVLGRSRTGVRGR